MLNNTIKYYQKISDEALKNLAAEKKYQFRKMMKNVSLMRANESYFLKLHNSEKARELISKYTKDMQNMHILATKEYNLTLAKIKATNDPILKQKLLNDYANAGITGFTAKNGARWNIETYSRMYSIHVNNQLLRMSVFENAKNDLFQVSNHNTQCDLCKPWEGGIFTREEIDGSTLFHPNCKHFVTEVRRSDSEVA
jgi:hypothetical protein